MLILVKMRSANLRYANLSGANIRYADLKDANLSGADLRYSYLEKARLGNNYWFNKELKLNLLNSIFGLYAFSVVASRS